MQNIEILYEDKELLVCVKPAGLAVQTKKLTEPDLESELKRQRQSDIYVVHRLDQPVKGLMVFAKTKAAAAALSSQVQQEGGMHKEYIARVFKTDAASDTLLPEP